MRDYRMRPPPGVDKTNGLKILFFYVFVVLWVFSYRKLKK